MKKLLLVLLVGCVVSAYPVITKNAYGDIDSVGADFIARMKRDGKVYPFSVRVAIDEDGVKVVETKFRTPETFSPISVFFEERGYPLEYQYYIVERDREKLVIWVLGWDLRGEKLSHVLNHAFEEFEISYS